METIQLQLRGREVRSVFGLLGYKENALTYSLGWTLAKSPRFLRAFVRTIVPGKESAGDLEIRLQQHGRHGDYTDLEIESKSIFFIVEAKLGWNLPSKKQLSHYRRRFQGRRALQKRLITLSRCSPGYAEEHLPSQIRGIPVSHLSWGQIRQLTKVSQRSETNVGKRLLAELDVYLGDSMQSPDSRLNLVYVVSLSTGTPKRWKISWIDIIEKKSRYFFPAEMKGWPKTPPTYVAFRYRGKLQSIHHIKDYEVIADMHTRIPEIPREKVEDCFLMHLDRGFSPKHTVKTGGIYPSGRVWCFIDTLLTSRTVKEAQAKTKRRQRKMEG